jgi:methylmalonyl-CoA/ethylmalonyl-CoA epimerase
MSRPSCATRTLAHTSQTLTRLHHIGYVVRDIQQAAPEFVKSMGSSWDGRIIADPIQGVRVSFLTQGCQYTQIELLESDSPTAPIAKFLREKGQGLHHLCFEVDDLEASVKELRATGGLLAKPPKPAVAFGGRRIAWLINSQRLLLELLESELHGTTF